MKALKIKRNEPCPCGSGKKYKKCCFDKESAFDETKQDKPKFKFEPGSYGDVGNFMPSIACMKQNKDNWKYHFVLAKITETVANEDEAVVQAIKDLDKAFKKREKTGSDNTVGEVLRNDGYVSINDFHIFRSN